MKYLLELSSLFIFTIFIIVVLLLQIHQIEKIIIILCTTPLLLSIYIYFKCFYSNINNNETPLVIYISNIL